MHIAIIKKNVTKHPFDIENNVTISHLFLKNFVTMAVISLSVAVISYIIGILAKELLGIEAY